MIAIILVLSGERNCDINVFMGSNHGGEKSKKFKIILMFSTNEKLKKTSNFFSVIEGHVPQAQGKKKFEFY